MPIKSEKCHKMSVEMPLNMWKIRQRRCLPKIQYENYHYIQTSSKTPIK